MSVSQAKITLKLTLSLSFLFYVVGIKEFKLDTFRITDHEMFYEMVVLCIICLDMFMFISFPLNGFLKSNYNQY